MPWSRLPCRLFPLPFDSEADVAAGAEARVVGNPQHLVWGEVLIIPSDDAPSFRLESIFIGTALQQVAEGALAATTFSEVAVNNLLALDCAYPGKDIALTVTNTGGAGRRFLASLFCIVRPDNC